MVIRHRHNRQEKTDQITIGRTQQEIAGKLLSGRTEAVCAINRGLIKEQITLIARPGMISLRQETGACPQVDEMGMERGGISSVFTRLEMRVMRYKKV